MRGLSEKKLYSWKEANIPSLSHIYHPVLFVKLASRSRKRSEQVTVDLVMNALWWLKVGNIRFGDETSSSVHSAGRCP